jgi:hypothetical protein
VSEPPAYTPVAGWYPEPNEPSVLRYWDGTKWTEHLQPAPQPVETVSKPTWFTNRNVVIALVAMAAIVTLFFALSSGDSESGGGATGPAEELDANAKAHARTVQTAIETYATDNDGAYAGATPEALMEIEPMLADATIAVQADAETYVVSAESESGTIFSISRDPTGTATLSCDTPGTGGCPDSGDWSGE